MTMRPLRKVAIGLWIAVFAAAGVFVATRYRDMPATATMPDRTVTGATAPEILPDITLSDLTGQQRSIREWSGRTVLINFWATWCAPCRKEMPLLEELQRSRDPAHLQVIGIAIDRLDPVLRFVAETGVTYPILVGQMDATRAAEQFGDAFVALPFSVVAAPDGTVLAVHTGELHAPDLEMIAIMADRLADGTIGVTAARQELKLGTGNAPAN